MDFDAKLGSIVMMMVLYGSEQPPVSVNEPHLGFKLQEQATEGPALSLQTIGSWGLKI